MVLGIFGAGGNGKMALDMVDRINVNNERWSEVIFVDDVIGVKEFHGLNVCTFQEAIEKYSPQELELVISLGEPEYRELVYNKIMQLGVRLATIIDPDAEVDSSAQIGNGVAICKGAYIGSDSVIEDNVLVIGRAVVGHDTTIKKHCNISAFAFIAGHCVLEEKVYVGPTAAMIDRLHIGTGSVIGLNAALYKDVPDNMVAIGNPARIVKREKGKNLF